MRLWEIINENHGKYYCSTDKKWKYRKGPKQTRKVNERGIPDYTTMSTYKLKKAHKGKQKFFLPSDEPTPKGVKAIGEKGLDNIPATLYHSTYRPLLKSIKKYGLGGDKAQAKWNDSEPGVVYLALDKNVAESYAETSDVVPDEWLNEIVILKISTAGLDKNKFNIDSNVQDNEGDTIEYRGIIPVTNISLIKQGVPENFADGKKKGKSRPGRVKRSGASCKGSVTSLRAKAKKYSGERGKMYHWCANMKSGRKKK